ncbi:MAG: DUF2780 domain-containing protein [Deltaproteobacteria bacterium]|nr:DUF2780 domain-containing protein [Deltaproteobacteria bacterium]
MLELISQLTSHLGLSQEQAQGGLGSVLNFAKSKLAADEFAQVTGALGAGTDEAMALAQGKTAQAGGGGGLMGALGGLAGGGSLGGALGGLGGALGGAFGGTGAGALGDITKMTALVKSFEAFKMDSSTLTKFLPIVLSFLQQKGGDGLAGLISKLI